jgi:multicomponent Na+:H+ antiporter subunit C
MDSGDLAGAPTVDLVTAVTVDPVGLGGAPTVDHVMAVTVDPVGLGGAPTVDLVTAVTVDPVGLGGAPTVNLVMAVTVGGLYSIGFYLLLQRSLMRVLLGVVVLGHGTNLLLQLVGGPPARVPIVGQSPPRTFADPFPQALALTAVVITFALTTFLLALGYRSFTLVRHDTVQDDLEDRRIARAQRPAASLETGDDEAEAEDAGASQRASASEERTAAGSRPSGADDMGHGMAGHAEGDVPGPGDTERAAAEEAR